MSDEPFTDLNNGTLSHYKSSRVTVALESLVRHLHASHYKSSRV